MPGPIITISREHGSGGKLIGETLAQKLGVPFYCKEVAALAAEEGGLNKELKLPISKKGAFLENSIL